MNTPIIAEFTLSDGNPVSVNLERVDYFQPADEGTLIVFADNVCVTVSEPYDAVAEVLNPERQAGS